MLLEREAQAEKAEAAKAAPGAEAQGKPTAEIAGRAQVLRQELRRVQKAATRVQIEQEAETLPVWLDPRTKQELLESWNEEEYWNDPRIHVIGNAGVMGGFHALIAPLSTHMIDLFAYNGQDLRTFVLDTYIRPGDRVCDLACGVGFSTKDVGVDTSNQMLGIARWMASDPILTGPNFPKMLTGPKKFVQGNAETYGGDDEFDVSTTMFGFHEMPRSARRKVLRNMLRIAKTALVVDIHPSDYEPTESMLLGEPYIQEYRKNARSDMQQLVDSAAREGRPPVTLEEIEVIPGQAILWKLVRGDAASSADLGLVGAMGGKI